MARLAPTYLPRDPHGTVLYRLVKEHGAAFLRHARESYDRPLPRYVEDELRGYLRCGDFSKGFVHLRTPCVNPVLDGARGRPQTVARERERSLSSRRAAVPARAAAGR